VTGMHRKELPSREFLRAHLRYDPVTGLLYRKSTGKVASKRYTHRYPRVSIKGVYYYAHRLIWRMEISDVVPDEIDHINEDKDDNRLENFRPASRFENMSNKSKAISNTSGYKGVNWHVQHDKWNARITVHKRRIHLGYFDDLEAAHAAYVEAAKKYHGDFANDGFGPICP
jgi:hypothetical protein